MEKHLSVEDLLYFTLKPLIFIFNNVCPWIRYHIEDFKKGGREIHDHTPPDGGGGADDRWLREGAHRK